VTGIVRPKSRVWRAALGAWEYAAYRSRLRSNDLSGGSMLLGYDQSVPDIMGFLTQQVPSLQIAAESD
jgi:hypothetical protein